MAKSLLILAFGFFMVGCDGTSVQKPSGGKEIGQKVEALNGVPVYYNGTVSNISGRNLTADGYNLGLKFQCVEFVKRYYYEFYNHKMPNSYGNAKDFFDAKIPHGKINRERGLLQFHNNGQELPEVGDLLIWDASIWNKFGHVAIVSKVYRDGVEVVQQNPGPFSKNREILKVQATETGFRFTDRKILGWLRKVD